MQLSWLKRPRLQNNKMKMKLSTYKCYFEMKGLFLLTVFTICSSSFSQVQDDLYFKPTKKSNTLGQKDSLNMMSKALIKNDNEVYNNTDSYKIEFNNLTNKYFSEGVITCDSINKELLYNGSYKWLATVKYATTVGNKGISLKDKKLNRIFVKQHYITSSYFANAKVRFTLTLEFRDGRYKYNYTNFNYDDALTKAAFENLGSFQFSQKSFNKLITETESYISTSMDELKAYLTFYKTDNDW
jgi:hypothetical protein